MIVGGTPAQHPRCTFCADAVVHCRQHCHCPPCRNGRTRKERARRNRRERERVVSSPNIGNGR